MGIDYKFNAGYGFLLPLKENALPAMWDDREMWYEGIVDKEIDGSGLVSVLGGNQWTGDEVWGFIAEGTLTSMSKYSNDVLAPIRDVDPVILGNLFDLRSRVKRPKARIGWTMWVDIS